MRNLIGPNREYIETGEKLSKFYSGHTLDRMNVDRKLGSDILCKLPTREEWCIANQIVNTDKIRWAINSFNPFKSLGPVRIFTVLLQKGVEYIAPILCRLFLVSLATKYVLEAWMSARVVFIPKPRLI